MTKERFRQVRHVFDAAMEQPDADRAAWVADACQADESLRAEVNELLRHHQKQSGVLDIAAPGVAEIVAGLRLEGRRIGSWEILREIGRGGMGVVYLARRADGAFQMAAALKILTATFANDEMRQRFQQERDILARLSHPNIARLLDGGTTEGGLPYLVMEFVDGQPLTDWCDDRRASIGDRLELLKELCQVVHYLHQNKVIHRDLKPANVFVDKNGNLKLLDFGISKLLGPVGEPATLTTRSGLHILTPEYASPEQVLAGSITPRTDIYALGVIAYELLTGRRPYSLRSRAMHAVMRAICEEEPERPSAVVTQQEEAGRTDLQLATVSRLRRSSPEELSQRLRGDLDEVVLKALRKEASQRYRTAEEFAQDLSAQGTGGSVIAQRDPLTRRILKWVAEHRASVVLTMAAAVLVWSGAVTIHVQAIVYGLGTLAALSAWYAVTDPEISGHIKTATTTWKGFLLLAILVSSATVAVVASVPLGFVNLPGVLSTLFFAGTLIYLNKIARWVFRQRRAGKLLVDASVSLPVWYRLLIGSGFLFFFCPLILIKQVHLTIPLHQVSQLLCFTVMSLHTWIIAGKLELRQRGIIGYWLFYPWDQIDAWSWESLGPGQPISQEAKLGYSGRRQGWLLRKNAALRLELRNTGLFRQSGCLPISPAKVEDTANVLSELLGNWPSGQEVRVSPEQESIISESRADTQLNRRAHKRVIYLAVASIASAGLAFLAEIDKAQIDRFISGPSTPFWQSLERSFRNPVDGLQYSWIPPGSFSMGCSSRDQACDQNERPAHEVKITRGFWIGKTEVTVAAYNRSGRPSVAQP